ncbi:MAG: (Fe-S)-binding protein [Actinomycetota bacterium]|nr:(Fe-S)-binding protein [Actinomycetota bacterium]
MPGPRVSLFTTCLVDLLRPQIGEATVRVLQRAGATVDVPVGQSCCGQPAWNAGDRVAARHFVEQWLETFGRAAAVVSPSGSCVSMVRHQFPRAVEPPRRAMVEEVASRTYELSEYLIDVLGVSDLGAERQGRVAYHPACHGLRGLGVEEQPLRLLDSVTGLEVRQLPPTCCGFGGFFSLRYPEVSVALADRRKELLGDADLLVSTDAGCLLHLRGRFEQQGTDVQTLHLAEVLAG